LAGSSHANGGVWFGSVQHTIEVEHGVESSHPKSYMLASIFVTGASWVAAPSCFVELSSGVVCEEPHAAAMANTAVHAAAERRGDMTRTVLAFAARGLQVQSHDPPHLTSHRGDTWDEHR
jgi:hypothetical protein